MVEHPGNTSCSMLIRHAKLKATVKNGIAFHQMALRLENFLYNDRHLDFVGPDRACSYVN